jgi:hypothetical protein
MLWYSTVDAQSSYLGLFLPGMLVMSAGMGFIFVPLTSVAVARVRETDAGVASALLNVGQQVGGSIGLSVLATVAATAGRSASTNKVAELTSLIKGGHLNPDTLAHVQQLAAAQTGHKPSLAALHDSTAAQAVAQIQAHSSGMGFLAAAIFGVAGVIVALVLINAKKEDIPAEPALEAVAA